VEAGRWKEKVKGQEGGSKEGGSKGSIGTGTPSTIPNSFLSCLFVSMLRGEMEVEWGRRCKERERGGERERYSYHSR
jgi:hypothetical protein